MEPERKIEKWLRAFAKKRREQAGEPMELRPAARQLLQREIARQSEQKSRGFFSQLFFGLRPSLAFAICFIVLATSAFIFWPSLYHRKPGQLSMNKTSYPEMAPSAPAPETPPAVTSPSLANADKKVLKEKLESTPPAPTPPPVVFSANRAPAETSKAETRAGDRAESAAAQKQLVVTTAAATPTPSTNTLFAYKNETAADSLDRAGAAAKDEGTISSTPIPAASSFIAGALASNANAQTALAFQRTVATPISTNAGLFDLAKTTGAVTVSQVFNRLEVPPTRRNAAGSVAPSAPVLASFRVEQNGNNLKVVDRDGSVYTGSVQIAQQEPASDASFAAARNRPIGAATRSLKADVPTPQSYFFRVAGTNRNLNETVVFSGNFVPFTNDQLTAGARGFGGAGGGFGGGGGAGPAAGQPIQAVLSNSQISGNVVIGDQKPVDLTATPVH